MISIRTIYQSPPSLSRDGTIKVLCIGADSPRTEEDIAWEGHIVITESNHLQIARALASHDDIEIGDYIKGYRGKVVIRGIVSDPPIAPFWGRGSLFYKDVELTKVEKLEKL